MISDGLGGVLLFWQDSRSGNDDIYGQRVDAAGNVLWKPNGAPICIAAGSQLHPRAISDGHGGAIVVWDDSRDPPNIGVYAQHVDVTGETQWSATGVPISTAAGSQVLARIVSDGSSGGVVVWAEVSNNQTHFRGQRIGTDGALQWASTGLLLTPDLGYSRPPSITSDDSGGVILAIPRSVTGARIKVQRLDASGALRWGPAGVELVSISAQEDPKCVRDGQGGAVVLWPDYRGGNGNETAIYGQRVDAMGNLLWTTNGVTLSTPANEGYYFEMDSDGNGGAVFAWTDWRYPDRAVRSQKVTYAGVPAWPLIGVPVCTAPNERTLGELRSDGAGGLLVCWSDEREWGSDLYAQRITFSGGPSWGTDGVKVSGAAYIQVGSRLTSDGAGGAYLAWLDSRNGEYDVYAQNVRANGQLGGSTGLSVPDDPGSSNWSLRLVGANPFRGPIEVECSLPAGAYTSLGLFDIAGRLLEEHALGNEQMTDRRIRLNDGPRTPSGLYFIRLARGQRQICRAVVLIR